ncbi:MAG: hypothetical protein MI757_11015 [Pirellulales bacterium]|nr:hypothetical protein [Pirellulales bacterium]
MTSSDWSALATIVVPIVLAMTPWMFMVHAKLAVIAAKVSDLCETIKQANREQLRLSSDINRLEMRINVLEAGNDYQEGSHR